MFDSIKKFFGPVEGAVKGDTKPEEVGRASVFAAVSGVTFWTVVSILWEIVQTVVSDPSFSTFAESIKTLFQDKNYVAVVIMIGTFIFDVLRRKYLHGK